MRKKLELTERVIKENEGGDLGNFIKKFKGKEFVCCTNNSTKKKYNLDEFRAHKKEHSDGLANADGKKYWTYWTCPGCNLDWNYHHIITVFSNQKS